jgi:hypothetical protein
MLTGVLRIMAKQSLLKEFFLFVRHEKKMVARAVAGRAAAGGRADCLRRLVTTRAVHLSAFLSWVCSGLDMGATGGRLVRLCPHWLQAASGTRSRQQTLFSVWPFFSCTLWGIGLALHPCESIMRSSDCRKGRVFVARWAYAVIPVFAPSFFWFL